MLSLALVAFPARPLVPDAGVVKDTLAGRECGGAVQSAGGHGFRYCGQHWKLAKLPIRFRLNLAGMPANLAGSSGLPSQFELAARAAALTWDEASPVAGTGSKGGCLASTRIVCIESVGFTGEIAFDGIPTIRWDAPGATAAPAVAYLWPPFSRVLTDVDITLNAGRDWYWAGPDAVTGAALGAAAYFCIVCPERLDLQSILTHEIGHAIGLDHPNPGSPKTWPEDAEDAPDYNQVMYERYYRNNATQRALGWGDLLGLNVVLTDSTTAR